MNDMWDGDLFCQALMERFRRFENALATEDGEWVIKGFIDVYRKIYTISVDTKVISKLIELMLIPIIVQLAQELDYRFILSEHQNHYPDISFVTPRGVRVALDLKSTYRINERRVNGFTLGAFTGYFRDRTSAKNVTFPYGSYVAHYVLGVIYTRNSKIVDDQRIYELVDLTDIVSVVREFEFLLQEKWRIAHFVPGSGNTKNIGSIREIDALIEGQGPFSQYNEAVFDDYWTNYLTQDMAQRIESAVPFRTLDEYWAWRERAPGRDGDR